MGRAPCSQKNGLKKGPWTTEEDLKLTQYIERHGPGSWRTLPKNAGLERCGKSCRLRWTNYLRPDIKRGRFTFEEEETIIQLHSLLGNKWSAIASRLPGRTDNEIKNYWNTHIRKRLLRMGLDPVTHTPKYSSSSAGEELNILSKLLMALNQSQVQLLANPQLVSIVSSLMTLNQLTGINCKSWEQNVMEHQLSNDVMVMQPYSNNSVERLISGQQEVVQGQQMQIDPVSYEKKTSFNYSDSFASSPMNSSFGNNNVDDVSSFFDFDVLEGFDICTLL